MAFLKSEPPHIRSPRSLKQWMWAIFLSLCPILITSMFYYGFNAIRVYALSWLAAILSHYAAKLFFKKKRTAVNPDYLIVATLYALMLPPTLPTWIIFAGAVVCCFFGMECFGGYGSTLFHPAALGMAFIYFSFPSVLKSHYLLSSRLEPAFYLQGLNDWLQNILSKDVMLFLFGNNAAMGDVSAFVILAAGVIMLWTARIRWEFPVFFLISLGFCALLMGGGFSEHQFSGGFLLTAFFFMALPGFSPMTASGMRAFIILTAAITGVFWRFFPYFVAWSFAVLLIDLFIPWTDEWIRPRLSRLSKVLASEGD